MAISSCAPKFHHLFFQSAGTFITRTKRCTSVSLNIIVTFFVFGFLFGLLLVSAATHAKETYLECQSCHAEQVKDWLSSHHYHAMAEASETTVLANFEDQTILYQGHTVRFYRKDKEYFVAMPNLKSEIAPYRITHTFGYEPLQQYMFTEGDGKYQFIPFAWDSRSKKEGGQRWFVLYPDMEAHDEFHWSQMGQNWNHMCAECHTTDYKKNFDLKTQQYSTSYSAINVSCNACHGDSQQHLAWAKARQNDAQQKDKAAQANPVDHKGFEHYIGTKTPMFRANDAGIMQSIAQLKESQQIESCAACHSRRTALDDRGKPQDYFHNYRPALLTDALYHLDGQILDEDYVWGSFLQSKMYQAGVTCTNCHNPHSGKLKFSGNQTCTQCHDAKSYETKAHHGHAPNTAGAFCVDCHMPQTTFMQVDARRDHSFQIPRPDLSRQFDVPNACTSCHEDRGNRWAENEIKKLHPKSKYLGQEHFAKAFYAVREHANDADQQLTKIAQNSHLPDIVRASALVRMQQTPGQNAIVAISRAVRDDDPIKRIAAVEASSPYELPDRWRMLNVLLDDPHMPVRIEAARDLAALLVEPSTLAASDQTRLRKALEEYRAAQLYQADRGFAHANLGNLALQLGNSHQAEQHYQKAIEIEPIFMPAHVNLADLYRLRHDEAKVQSILQNALTINAEANAVQYALALSYVRAKQKDKALEHLHKAATEGQPDGGSIYAYALLLQESGQSTQALTQFKRAYDVMPHNPDISYSLMQLYLARGDRSNALLFARRLNQLVPGNAQLQQMLRQIESMPNPH